METKIKGLMTKKSVGMLALGSLLLIAIYGLWQRLGIAPLELMNSISSLEELRTLIESKGERAILFFVAIQATQVILAPIPGELTGSLAGILFGPWAGTWIATVGLLCGTTLAFLLGRLLGRPLVDIFVSQKTHERFKFLENRRALLIVFVLYLIPGFPKDALTYLLALGPTHLLPFLLVSNLGRLPGTAMLCYSAAAFGEKNYLLLSGISMICLIIIIASFVCRQRLWHWLRHGDSA
jgi:uncharacterized membrane protein YdjX (TVP38/TMEM64 family)